MTVVLDGDRILALEPLLLPHVLYTPYDLPGESLEFQVLRDLETHVYMDIIDAGVRVSRLLLLAHDVILLCQSDTAQAYLALGSQVLHEFVLIAVRQQLRRFIA